MRSLSEGAAEAVLQRALYAVGPAVPSDRFVEDVASLLHAGEALVAFEVFATQVDEYDVPITPNLAEDLAAAGKALGAAPKYGEWLVECSRPR